MILLRLIGGCHSDFATFGGWLGLALEKKEVRHEIRDVHYLP